MVKKISFFSLRNIRNAVRILAVSQGGNFLYILQHGCKFSSWLMVNSYFDQLLLATNLHPCRKIRATECVQRTIALYQYKLLNLFPFSVIEFSEVVMFKPWTQYLWSKSGTLFFFFTRHAQPPLGLWLRALQCEWINILLRTPSICFLLDRNALRFSLCCKGNPETQVQCDYSLIFYLLLVASLRLS